MNSVAMVTIFLQITLPTNITQRLGHSAASFGTGPDFRVVVVFGGSTRSSVPPCAISETMLLFLSKLPPSLRPSCIPLYTVIFTSPAFYYSCTHTECTRTCHMLYAGMLTILVFLIILTCWMDIQHP